LCELIETPLMVNDSCRKLFSS